MTPAPVYPNHPSTRNRHVIVQIAMLVVAVLGLSAIGIAQGLNGEGVTGPYQTPYAYRQPSPVKGLGHPTFAFRTPATGPVIGKDRRVHPFHSDLEVCQAAQPQGGTSLRHLHLAI